MSGAQRVLAAVTAVARSAALPAGLALGVIAASLWLGQVALVTHDVGWLLLGARRLLAGAELYVDGFVDVNPPGSLFWMAPAVVASQLSAVAETRIFPLYVWLWGCASLWLCDRLLRAHFDAGEQLARPWAWVALAFVFGIWPAAGFDALPVHNLGQREHLVVLFLTPGILLAALRARGRRPAPALAVASGLLAGIPLSAKPQYLVCVVALEVWWRIRARALRPLVTPELAALAAIGVAYVAALLWITPAYLQRAVPLALDTYWAYQRPLDELIERRDLVVIVVAAVVPFAVRRRASVSLLCDAFAIATVTAYLGFLLGGTSWPYHKLPLRSFALLTAASALLALPARATRSALRPALAAAVVGVAAALGVFVVQALPWQIDQNFHAMSAWKYITVDRYRELVEREAPGGPLLVLASGLPPAFPLVNYAGIEWSSRFSCQWIVPALERARMRQEGPASLTPQRLDELEGWLVDSVVEDMNLTPPAVVLVQAMANKIGFGGLRVDYIEYFSRDPRFRRIWSGYRPVGEIGGYDAYVRVEPLAGAAR